MDFRISFGRFSFDFNGSSLFITSPRREVYISSASNASREPAYPWRPCLERDAHGGGEWVGFGLVVSYGNATGSIDRLQQAAA